MKKIRKLIILIMLLLLFGMLHCYTERKFSNSPSKGMTEQIEDWTNQLGLN